MLKILYIGNSFSVDVLEHAVNVAHDLGIREIKIGNLYHPACSLKMHLQHATEDAPAYIYYENYGNGWEKTPDTSIAAAIAHDDWDIIGIFPGTGDGSAHSSHEAYECLPELIRYVRERATLSVKLMYNLTWLSEKENPKKELALYNGDQTLVMSMIADRLREHVLPSGQFWKVVPTGAAVQNARRAGFLITRDGYHLSYGMGRLMGALTVIGSATDADLSKLTWMPEGVTEQERDLAVQFARNALLDPFFFG